MRLIKSGVLLGSAISLLAISACNPANDSKPADPDTAGPAVATVNGKVISKKSVDMLIEQGAGSGRPDTPETRKAIIDQLAMQMLLAEEAIKKGLDKSPEVVDQMEVIRQSVLANAYVQDFIKNNPVSTDALQAEYDRIKATITGSEYKARHILVESEGEAKDIIAKLKKDPGQFEKLAKELSLDAGSKVKGGDLGWFDLSRMVPEFGDAVAKLEKGQFTDEPVKSQFGYHVILLDDIRPIEAPPLEAVTPQLTEQMQQQELQKQLEALKAGAKIEFVGDAASKPSADSPAAESAPAAESTPTAESN